LTSSRNLWNIEENENPNHLIFTHGNKWRFFGQISQNRNPFQIKRRWDGILENNVDTHLNDTYFMLNNRKIQENKQIPSFTKIDKIKLDFLDKIPD
jgi:hypothetical protein